MEGHLRVTLGTHLTQVAGAITAPKLCLMFWPCDP